MKVYGIGIVEYTGVERPEHSYYYYNLIKNFIRKTDVSKLYTSG